MKNPITSRLPIHPQRVPDQNIVEDGAVNGLEVEDSNGDQHQILKVLLLKNHQLVELFRSWFRRRHRGFQRGILG